MAFKSDHGQCSCGNICNRLEKSGACPCLIQIQQNIFRYWRCCLLAGRPNFAVSRGRFNPTQCPFKRKILLFLCIVHFGAAVNLTILYFQIHSLWWIEWDIIPTTSATRFLCQRLRGALSSVLFCLAYTSMYWSSRMVNIMSVTQCHLVLHCCRAQWLRGRAWDSWLKEP